MDRRLGIEVVKGHGLVSPRGYLGRDLAGNDPAKDAIGHSSSLVAGR
jgi:hypothetical protein